MSWKVIWLKEVFSDGHAFSFQERLLNSCCYFCSPFLFLVSLLLVRVLCGCVMLTSAKKKRKRLFYIQFFFLQVTVLVSSVLGRIYIAHAFFPTLFLFLSNPPKKRTKEECVFTPFFVREKQRRSAGKVA